MDKFCQDIAKFSNEFLTLLEVPHAEEEIAAWATAEEQLGLGS